MNTLIQINDSLAHAPVGAIAMLFAIALGYMLKSAAIFPNPRIPLVVLPVTAILYALIQLCADMVADKPHAWLYFLLNFVLGFIYGFIAWFCHAQLLKRYLDPRLFNDDGSTKFLSRDGNPPSATATGATPPATPPATRDL